MNGLVRGKFLAAREYLVIHGLLMLFSCLALAAIVWATACPAQLTYAQERRIEVSGKSISRGELWVTYRTFYEGGVMEYGSPAEIAHYQVIRKWLWILGLAGGATIPFLIHTRAKCIQRGSCSATYYVQRTLHVSTIAAAAIVAACLLWGAISPHYHRVFFVENYTFHPWTPSAKYWTLPTIRSAGISVGALGLIFFASSEAATYAYSRVLTRWTVWRQQRLAHGRRRVAEAKS